VKAFERDYQQTFR